MARRARRESGPNPYAAVFLPLWGGMVALQSGLLIHDVAAAWIISGKTTSHGVVALAQTASALPFFLFALPAGALADMVERRKLAEVAALVLAGLSLAVALAFLGGVASVPLLLAASFVNGCCNAAFTPSWQAMTPELVETERLPGALALNSLGINVARSVGPLLSGLLLYAWGPAAAFLFNSLLYLSVAAIFLLIAPRRPAPAARESLAAAIAGGLAYARHSKGLKTVALKAVGFFLFAATFWALVPVVVRDWHGGTSLMLGAMVGCVGVGAIIGAKLLRGLRARMDLDRIMLLAGLLGAGALALLPLAPVPAALAGLQVVLGFCWLLAFSSIHLAAQLRLAPWIRARGSAIYLIAVFGSLALGSFLAGLLSDRIGLTATFFLAAGGLALSTLFARGLVIAIDGPEKPAKSMVLPELAGLDPAHPVEVSITYFPRPGEGAAAGRELAELKAARLRTGARAWRLEVGEGELVEHVRYDRGARLESAAGRHTAADIETETRLLARLTGRPRVRTAPNSEVRPEHAGDAPQRDTSAPPSASPGAPAA